MNKAFIKHMSCLLVLCCVGAASSWATIDVDGTELEVVDVHLHTGKTGDLNPDGKAFIISALPDFTVLYYPAVTSASTNPWSPHLGIKSQTEWAGVDHGVLLAAYTHHTTGFMTNKGVDEILRDPRNKNEDGTPWAWGMASINFDDFTDPGVAETRLDALASYFEQRRDRFIGIKLAHAHQAVTFDDPDYLGVYDIAATHQVPVLLHTGSTPFPNAANLPEYYDPDGLETTIIAYDGDHGQPRVEFVLSHVGRADMRAVESALRLAETYENVWLELSALGGPVEIGLDGEPVEATEAQYFYVLEQILARGIVDKAIFASDGPQSSGKVKIYLEEMVAAMQGLNYEVDEIAQVLAGNFYRCYGLSPRR